MTVNRSLFLACISFLVLLSACPDKKPSAPPQELLDQVAAAENIYNEIPEPGRSEQNPDKYLKLMEETRTKMAAGDYEAAMTSARWAELAAVRLKGRVVYQELLSYDPPKELTFYYRQNLKKSEDAEAAGDVGASLTHAREALRQASLSLPRTLCM